MTTLLSSLNRSTRSIASSGLLVLLTAAVAAERTLAQSAAREESIFRFETAELWLNLHHFLHVLGRYENRTRDSQRDAVVRAPADAERGLARLSDDERAPYLDGRGTRDEALAALVRRTATEPRR